MDLKKSGENTYARYKYFELGDFLPAANELMLEEKLIGIVSYLENHAELKIVNIENTDETIIFSCPNANVELKGAHAIQNAGACQTYQRRYLYLTALEIVESDVLDATQGMPNQRPQPQPQPKRKLISDDTAKAINERIKIYSEKSGLQFKEITKELEKLTHKGMAVIDENDAKLIINYLTSKITKSEEKGVENGQINEEN
jgi:hypothetical protein